MSNKEYIDSVDSGITESMVTYLAHRYAISLSMRYMDMYNLHTKENAGGILEYAYSEFYERKLEKLTNKYLGEIYEKR